MRTLPFLPPYGSFYWLLAQSAFPTPRPFEDAGQCLFMKRAHRDRGIVMDPGVLRESETPVDVLRGNA